MKRPIHKLTVLVVIVGFMTLLPRDQMAQGAGATASPPKTIKKATVRRRSKIGPSRLRRNPNEPVSLWVVSKPPNSKVFADGQLQGETNAEGELELKLTPGTHAIRVARDGYVTSEAEVEFAATREASEVEFVLAQAVASLNVVTNPTEAEVYLDDVYKGGSNANGLLVIERVNPSQPHTLRVAKPGYQSQTVPVTTYAGQISIALVSNSSKLRVTTNPPEAEVYVDDVYRGTSTGDGVLIIDGINPNQTHTVRSKKDGYQRQSITVPPNISDVTIKLSPDPVVLLIKSLRQNLASGRLGEAFDDYTRLNADAPDHQEMNRLLDSLIQSLQARSTDLLARVGPYGLLLDAGAIQEINVLYKLAKKWRVGDEAIENLARYWELKNTLVSGSASESDRKTTRGNLIALGEHNLRNPHLLLEMGWAWAKLNDKPAALKLFDRTQEVKPDWAYPHFARGVLAMNEAESELKKSVKTLKYQQGIENFSKAITLKHDFALAYALRSISYGALKRNEDAIASGLQAVAIDPRSAYAHYALGLAYFLKGKSSYRNALSEFNQAMTVDGGELDQGIKSSIQQRLVVINKAIK